MMNPYSSARIFVSIASYRDSQLPSTVASLIEQADSPERLVIGVFNQVNLDEDQDCIAADNAYMLQHVLDYNEAQGACWARGYIWNKLLSDEDFALQIDSHSRFVKGWDSILLKMYAQLNDAHAVLTHYPMGFNTETHEFDQQLYTYFNVQSFRETGLPEVSSGAIDFAQAPNLPAPTAFIAAGCLFAPAHVFKQIPYDPYIYFHGEEITYAARLWTHGYNLYLPNQGFMWHDYLNLNKRPLHWQEHTEWELKDQLAQQRCLHVLRINKATDVRAIYQLEQYGMGFERSVEDYLHFAGLDLKHQIIHPKAQSGLEY